MSQQQCQETRRLNYRLVSKPFVEAAPGEPAVREPLPLPNRIDEFWLAGLLAGIARGLRRGGNFETLTREFVKACIPGAMAARLAAAVMPTHEEERGDLPG